MASRLINVPRFYLQSQGKYQGTYYPNGSTVAPSGGGTGPFLPSATPATANSITYATRGQGDGGALGGYSKSPYNALAFTYGDSNTLYRWDGNAWYPVSNVQIQVVHNLVTPGHVGTPPVGFSPDGNVCFIANGGTTPMRSTDQGVTWSAISSANWALGVSEVIAYFTMHSYDVNTVFAGTNQALWKSTNQGVSWTKLASATGTSVGTYLDYTGTTPTVTLYHATTTNIYTSSNLGTSFSTFYTAGAKGIRVFTGGRDTTGVTLSFVDTDTSAAAAQSPAVNYSGNFGFIWTSFTSGTGAASSTFTRNAKGGGIHLCMAENDSQTIWTDGGTGSSTQQGSNVWVSANGGSTWTKKLLQYDWTQSPFAPWPPDKLEYNAPALDIGWDDDSYWTFTCNPRNSSQAGGSGNFFLFTTADKGNTWQSPFTKYAFDTWTGTTLISGFTIPAANGSTTVNLATTGMTVGNTYYIGGSGHFSLTSITDSTHAVMKYLAFSDTRQGVDPGGNGITGAVVIAARLKQKNWQSTGLEDTSVYKAMFHPTNTQIMWAACADMGGLISEDAGNTFRVCQGPFNSNYDYALDPSNDQLAYMASGDHHDYLDNTFGVFVGNGGICKTTDRGKTWTRLTPTTGTWARQFLSVGFDYTNNVIYGGTEGGGMARSTDGGATWSAFNSGFPTLYSNIVAKIDVDHSTGDVYALIAGNAGETNGQASYSNNAVTGIYRCAWGSSTWSLLRTTVNRPSGTGSYTLWYYPVAFAIDYTSTRTSGVPSTMWMADIETNGTWMTSGIWKSTNAGVTWNRMTQYTHPRNITIDSANGRVYVSGRWQTDGTWGVGGCLHTTDGGTTWHQNTNMPLLANNDDTILDPNDSTKLFYAYFIGGMLYGPRP